MRNFFKKTLCVLLLVSLIVAALSFTSCKKDSDDGKEYTKDNTEFVIGVSGPLTGGAAVYGIGVKNAAQLAVDEINANGGLNGIKFKFVMLDDAHDAEKVPTNYASLFEGGMQVSLGTVTTGPALEFKRLANDDNVFFLTPSASGDDVPEFDNGYQMCFADGNQGKVAADYVNTNFAGQTIGVFYKSDDAYSSGIFNQFKQTVSKDVTLVETVFTDASATNFASQIDTLKDCNFIFMPIYYTPASIFMQQAKDKISANAVYYGCDGLDGIDSIEGFDLSTIPQEVSMLSHFNSKATEGAAKTFIDKYVEKFGTDTLNQFGASAYDCVYAIYNAMKDAKVDDVTISASELCEILKDKFNNGFTFSGVTGENITWESNGFVNKSAIKYIIKEAN